MDEQSSSVPAGAFSWHSQEEARLESWWSGALVDCFVGVHEGFKRLADPGMHRRRVLFVRDGYWVIVDTLLAHGTHDGAAHLHLIPGAVVIRQSPRSATLALDGHEGARRLMITAAGDAESLTWTDDWVSPIYGQRSPGPVAHVGARGAGRMDLVTVIATMAGSTAPVVRELPCEGGFATVVERSEGHDLLLIRRAGTLRADAADMHADVALVRRDAATGAPSRVALFGIAARMQLDDWIFRADTAAEFRRTGESWEVRGDGNVSRR